MAQRYKDEAGHIWEIGPDGKPSLVSAAPSLSLANPLIPGQLAAQPGQIANTQAQTGKTVVDTRAATAELPYVAPKAAAEARSAQANATIAEHKAAEEQIAANKAELEKFGGQEQVDQLIRAVERAKKLVSPWSAGAGAILKNLPATEAAKLDAIIGQEVRGNVFLQRIQALKDENPSPNGGTGIGRIMQAEIPMITGAAGTLDPYKLGPTETLNSLNQIEHGALRAKAKFSGQNPDDAHVLTALMPDDLAPTNGAPPPKIGPEQQAQFFKILQEQGPDKANEYLGQFGLAMKDKTAADRPYSHQLALPGGYADSYVGQGLSGANEGLADALGAPADLATAALNLIPKGINAVANTHIPEIADPLAGGQWWKRRLTDLGSIQPPSGDTPKQFTRRVGESVGAAAVPGMFGGSLPKFGAALLSGLGSGLGGATAQQVAPGNPLAEIGGELAGGGFTGLGLAKGLQRSARRQIESAVPTVEQLKASASDLYRKAETNGVVATSGQTQQLADDIHGILRDEGQIGPAGKISDADTNTSKAYNLIQQYAGKEMSPKEMNTVRTVLADSRQSSDPADRRLGNLLLNHFDNWASPMAPEFNQARGVASRYLQAQDLERARELAGARASQFTGSGFENALRTEYRGLDRGNIKGQNYFAPDVTDAVQTVARGTPVSNALRGLGRLAPTGPVSMLGDLGAGAGMGLMAGSPVSGGMFGGGLAGLGVLGRVGATRMGIRAADKAELVARNGGALPQAPLMPDQFKKLAAWLAAVQQTKYLNGQ